MKKDNDTVILTNTCSRLSREIFTLAHEIDIVAYDSMGTEMVFGECKYSVNPKGMSVLQALQEKSVYVDWKKKERKSYFVLYSRSGFTPDLLSYAADRENIILMTG